MYQIFNKVISKIKGERFILDSQIPTPYLLLFFLSKLLYLVWGRLRFLTLKRVFLHPTSKIKIANKIQIGTNLTIGRRCMIDALSTNGISLGKNVSIGDYTYIQVTGNLRNLGTGLKIGNNVGLGTHGFWGCSGGIVVGNDTIFGNYVSLHSENHNYADLTIPIRLQGVNHKGIKIGSNCWIGAKVTILDGAIIGNGCIVAAGAVVRGEFPDNSIIGGVPAKILKTRQ
jgi:acetyltransferase-like isoleucine patch superfamily enzyme